MDWTSTPLGPPEQWPQSLISVVRIMLASRFSMWMAWGPELTFFCNDAYRRDTLGRKYPWALGRPAARGLGGDLARDRPTDRAGHGDRGRHLGRGAHAVPRAQRLPRGDLPHLLLQPAGGRRRPGRGHVLRRQRGHRAGHRARGAWPPCATSARTSPHLRSETEVVDAARASSPSDRWSVPFGLVYLLRRRSTSAVLGASAGVRPGHPAAPPVIDLGDPDAPWPVGELLRGARWSSTTSRSGSAPATGAWPEPPLRALAVPFRRQDEVRPHGFLVVALNRYRPLDADYRGFVELLADQIGTALSGARAYQEERERAERLPALDRAKTEFFTNVSHEFRTPLTLLLGPAEDALADHAHPLDDVQRDRVEIIQRNGERLLKLVNSLLDFSRLEDGDVQARYEPVDLAAYTGELAATFSVAVERAGLASPSTARRCRTPSTSTARCGRRSCSISSRTP